MNEKQKKEFYQKQNATETVKNCIARAIIAYPLPKYYAMIIATCYAEQVSQSGFMKEIIKKYFDSLPPREQKNLMDLYNEMKSGIHFDDNKKKNSY